MRNHILNGECSVYRVFDWNERLLYVGMSHEPYKRLMQHKRNNAPWIPFASWISILKYEHRSGAEFLEARAIIEESPFWNRQSPVRPLEGPAPEPLDGVFFMIPEDWAW